MAAFSDTELIDFVVGHATADQARAIEETARRDEELSAQLALMDGIANLTLIPAGPPSRSDVGFVGRGRWLMAAALAAVAVASALFLWQPFAGRPPAPPAARAPVLDESTWRVGRPIVWKGEDYVKLMNRGWLVSRKEYPAGVAVSFDWRWVEYEGEPVYREHLSIALRTSGQPPAQYAYEAADGIIVTFDTWSNTVSVWRAGQVPEPIATSPVGVPMPAGAWHRVRVEDDGNEISVFFSQHGAPPAVAEAPLIRIAVPRKPAAHHIAIYNREHVGGVPHESHLTGLTVSGLRSDPG